MVLLVGLHSLARIYSQGLLIQKGLLPNMMISGPAEVTKMSFDALIPGRSA